MDDGWTTAHGILKFGGKKRRDKIYCRFPLAHPISARASPAASPTKRRFLERRDAHFFSKAAYCTWTPTVTSLSALSLSLSPISHLEAGILNHRDGKQR